MAWSVWISQSSNPKIQMQGLLERLQRLGYVTKTSHSVDGECGMLEWEQNS